MSCDLHDNLMRIVLHEFKENSNNETVDNVIYVKFHPQLKCFKLRKYRTFHFVIFYTIAI